MEHDRVLKYLLKRMEPLRCVPFVLIYGCGTLGDERYPDTNFMQSVFDLYACRYGSLLLISPLFLSVSVSVLVDGNDCDELRNSLLNVLF
jgi:hypothetical protein